MPTSCTLRSPTTNDRQVAAPVAKPGHMFGTTAMMMKRNHHGFHRRVKPVIAVSPVASVQRSTSMLMKNWMAIATIAAHMIPSPTFEAMNGHSTYSPEPRAVASRMTPGPSTLRNGSGSGRSLIGTGPRMSLGMSGEYRSSSAVRSTTVAM